MKFLCKIGWHGKGVWTMPRYTGKKWIQERYCYKCGRYLWRRA